MRVLSNNILISAVIPAYNAEAFIARTINSVLSQTYKPLEIIIIDDGSEDNTAKIVRQYGNLIRYIFKENGGESSARNAGILKSNGDWIAFLDHDDEWLPHHLSNAVNIICQKKVKWYGASFNILVHETGEILKKYKKKINKDTKYPLDCTCYDDYLSVTEKYAIFTTSTMVINKNVFEKVGMFNENLHIGDLDMWYRIGVQFPRIGYCHSAAACAYKQHTSRHSSRTECSSRLKQYRAWENFAEQFGEDAKRRAAPWIMGRITKFLRSNIAKGDKQAVKSIFEIYEKRLSLIDKYMAKTFLLFPWLFRVFFKIRSTASKKQRLYRRHGLWSKK